MVPLKSTHAPVFAGAAGPYLGTFVVDLQVTINLFLAETNQAPKPFIWTADPDKIIATVKRGHHVLDSIH
jgi:hypothetical protein